MKIGDTSSIEPAGLTARVVAERAAARPIRPAAADGTDRVEISDVARAFGRLVGRVADAAPDPARAAQVEILRNAVATGRYQPDLDAVARKLLIEIAAEPRR
jgi:flagellar biosynthesis anti-sigma factor FlgM